MSTTTANDLLLSTASTTANIVQSAWPFFFYALALFLVLWAAYATVQAFVGALRRM